MPPIVKKKKKWKGTVNKTKETGEQNREINPNKRVMAINANFLSSPKKVSNSEIGSKLWIQTYSVYIGQT